MDKAVVAWFAAHDTYHKASHAYNVRLALVRSERERGNWQMNVHEEYRALHDAQSAALLADSTLYADLLARHISYTGPDRLRAAEIGDKTFEPLSTD